MEEQNHKENIEINENQEENKAEEEEHKQGNDQEEEKKEEPEEEKKEEQQNQNEIIVEQQQQQNQNEIVNANNNNQNNNQNNQIAEENNKRRQEEEAQKKKREENDRIVSLIKEKIKKLNSYYNFCLNYENIINKILLTLDELTYEKINNSLDDDFNFLYFFKNSAELYSKFAEEIQNCNKLITYTEKKPKMTDDFLSNVMQETQKLFYENLNKFSIGLRQKIVAKGPLSLLNEKKSKIDTLKKTQLKKFSELIDERKKLEKKYKSFQKLFESFVPELIPPNPNQNQNNQIIPQMPELIDAPDFICIIQDFMETINHLLKKITSFADEAKKSMKALNGLFVEVYNLMRESISIYINESKIFFNQDVTKKFKEIEDYLKKYDQNPNENSIFKLSRIFHNQQVKENIFNLLQQYYSLLCNSGTVKKELISDKNAFSVEKYNNVDAFFDWLISVLPNYLDIPIGDLVIKKFDIKRDPGIFSKWKLATMVFTRQHHLILFDKESNYKSDNVVKIFETDKITFRRKEDKKKGLLFEVNAVLKGKVMNFKGEFLFDALNMENLNQISEMINNQA